MTASAPVRTITCDRCGTKLRNGKWIFSYERRHYCVNIDACARRAKRRAS